MAEKFRFSERPVKLTIQNVPNPDCPDGVTALAFFKSDPDFIDMSDEEFADFVIRFAKRIGMGVDDIKMDTLDTLSSFQRNLEIKKRDRRVSSWGQSKMDKYNSKHANCGSGDDVNYKNLTKGGKTCMASSKKQRVKKGQDYYLVPETVRVTDHNGVVKDAPVTVHSSYSVSITTDPANLKAHPKTRDGKVRKRYYHLNASTWEKAVDLASSVGINGDRVTITKHDTTILATDTPVKRSTGTIHQWKNEDGTQGKGVTWNKGTGKTIYDNGGVPLGRVKVNKMQRHKRVYNDEKKAISYDDLPF